MNSIHKTDEHWMQRALALARKAGEKGEVPVGAIIIRNCDVLGEGYNCPIEKSDPSAHAEIIALRRACARENNYRLPGATLYTTLEPCPMCAGALVHARVRRVVFATADPRSGAAGSVMNILTCDSLNHRCEVRSGVLRTDCSALLENFFKSRRAGRQNG